MTYSTFSRATDSRINMIQGSGLGLAIAKQMVELMHGTIACQSEEGRGTTFVVNLELPEADEKQAEERREESGKNGTEFSDMHVLVAEDNYDGSILAFFEGDMPFYVCNAECVSGMKKRSTRWPVLKACRRWQKTEPTSGMRGFGMQKVLRQVSSTTAACRIPSARHWSRSAMTSEQACTAMQTRQCRRLWSCVQRNKIGKREERLICENKWVAFWCQRW